MLPDFGEQQAGQLEEASAHAVEFFYALAQFLVLLFWESRIEVSLENRFFGCVAQCLDESRVVQPVEHVFADVLELVQVRVQQDDAETVAVGEVAENVDESQVREHGQDADFPGLVDDLVGPGPAENVELVGVNLYKEKRLAGAVGTLEFFVQACTEQPCRVDNVLELLLVENRADG